MTESEALERLKNYRRKDGTIPEEIGVAISALNNLAMLYRDSRVVHTCQFISWYNTDISVPDCIFDSRIKGA